MLRMLSVLRQGSVVVDSLLLPLFVGVLCFVLVFYEVLSVHSSFAIILMRKLVVLLCLPDVL